MHPLNVHQRVCGRRRNLTEFRTFQVATLVLVGTICAATIVSPAQNPPLASTSAVTELVSSLAEPFKHLKAKSVVVLDFRGADGKEGPVGKWLPIKSRLRSKNNLRSSRLFRVRNWESKIAVSFS